MTTRGVAEAAGVQAPTIYRLFGDKDGLIDAVAEHVMATYVAAKTAASRPGDPVADLRAAWRMHIDFGLANPELYALLNPHGAGRRRPRPGSRSCAPACDASPTAGVLKVSEQRALELIHAAGSGTVLALLATPPEQRDPGLADAMLEAVLAAIVADRPGAGARRPARRRDQLRHAHPRAARPQRRRTRAPRRVGRPRHRARGA